MLTRKGTIGRRNRASMRRGRGAWGPGGSPGASSANSRGSLKGSRPGPVGYSAAGAGETSAGAQRRSLVHQPQNHHMSASTGSVCQAADGGQPLGSGDGNRLRAGLTSPSASVSSIASSRSREDIARRQGGEGGDDAISNSHHHPSHPVKGVSFADSVALAGEESLINRRLSGYSLCPPINSNFNRNCSSLYNKRDRNSNSGNSVVNKRISGSCSALMFGLADQYSEFTATGRLSTSSSGPFTAVDSLRQYQSKVSNSCSFSPLEFDHGYFPL